MHIASVSESDIIKLYKKYENNVLDINEYQDYIYIGI